MSSSDGVAIKRILKAARRHQISTSELEAAAAAGDMIAVMQWYQLETMKYRARKRGISLEAFAENAKKDIPVPKNYLHSAGKGNRETLSPIVKAPLGPAEAPTPSVGRDENVQGAILRRMGLNEPVSNAEVENGIKERLDVVENELPGVNLLRKLRLVAQALSAFSEGGRLLDNLNSLKGRCGRLVESALVNSFKIWDSDDEKTWCSRFEHVYKLWLVANSFVEPSEGAGTVMGILRAGTLQAIKFIEQGLDESLVLVATLERLLTELRHWVRKHDLRVPEQMQLVSILLVEGPLTLPKKYIHVDFMAKINAHFDNWLICVECLALDMLRGVAHDLTDNSSVIRLQEHYLKELVRCISVVGRRPPSDNKKVVLTKSIPICVTDGEALTGHMAEPIDSLTVFLLDSVAALWTPYSVTLLSESIGEVAFTPLLPPDILEAAHSEAAQGFEGRYEEVGYGLGRTTVAVPLGPMSVDDMADLWLKETDLTHELRANVYKVVTPLVIGMRIQAANVTRLLRSLVTDLLMSCVIAINGCEEDNNVTQFRTNSPEAKRLRNFVRELIRGTLRSMQAPVVGVLGYFIAREIVLQTKAPLRSSFGLDISTREAVIGILSDAVKAFGFISKNLKTSVLDDSWSDILWAGAPNPFEEWGSDSLPVKRTQEHLTCDRCLSSTLETPDSQMVDALTSGAEVDGKFVTKTQPQSGLCIACHRSESLLLPAAADLVRAAQLFVATSSGGLAGPQRTTLEDLCAAKQRLASLNAELPRGTESVLGDGSAGLVPRREAPEVANMLRDRVARHVPPYLATLRWLLEVETRRLEIQPRQVFPGTVREVVLPPSAIRSMGAMAALRFQVLETWFPSLEDLTATDLFPNLVNGNRCLLNDSTRKVRKGRKRRKSDTSVSDQRVIEGAPAAWVTDTGILKCIPCDRDLSEWFLAWYCSISGAMRWVQLDGEEAFLLRAKNDDLWAVEGPRPNPVGLTGFRPPANTRGFEAEGLTVLTTNNNERGNCLDVLNAWTSLLSHFQKEQSVKVFAVPFTILGDRDSPYMLRRAAIANLNELSKIDPTALGNETVNPWAFLKTRIDRELSSDIQARILTLTNSLVQQSVAVIRTPVKSRLQLVYKRSARTLLHSLVAAAVSLLIPRLQSSIVGSRDVDAGAGVLKEVTLLAISIIEGVSPSDVFDDKTQRQAPWPAPIIDDKSEGLTIADFIRTKQELVRGLIEFMSTSRDPGPLEIAATALVNIFCDGELDREPQLRIFLYALWHADLTERGAADPPFLTTLVAYKTLQTLGNKRKRNTLDSSQIWAQARSTAGLNICSNLARKWNTSLVNCLITLRQEFADCKSEDEKILNWYQQQLAMVFRGLERVTAIGSSGAFVMTQLVPFVIKDSLKNQFSGGKGGNVLSSWPLNILANVIPSVPPSPKMSHLYTSTGNGKTSLRQTLFNAVHSAGVGPAAASALRSFVSAEVRLQGKLRSSIQDDLHNWLSMLVGYLIIWKCNRRRVESGSGRRMLLWRKTEELKLVATVVDRLCALAAVIHISTATLWMEDSHESTVIQTGTPIRRNIVVKPEDMTQQTPERRSTPFQKFEDGSPASELLVSPFPSDASIRIAPDEMFDGISLMKTLLETEKKISKKMEEEGMEAQYKPVTEALTDDGQLDTSFLIFEAVVTALHEVSRQVGLILSPGEWEATPVDLCIAAEIYSSIQLSLNCYLEAHPRYIRSQRWFAEVAAVLRPTYEHPAFAPGSQLKVAGVGHLSAVRRHILRLQLSTVKGLCNQLTNLESKEAQVQFADKGEEEGGGIAQSIGVTSGVGQAVSDLFPALCELLRSPIAASDPELPPCLDGNLSRSPPWRVLLRVGTPDDEPLGNEGNSLQVEGDMSSSDQLLDLVTLLGEVEGAGGQALAAMHRQGLLHPAQIVDSGLLAAVGSINPRGCPTLENAAWNALGGNLQTAGGRTAFAPRLDHLIHTVLPRLISLEALRSLRAVHNLDCPSHEPPRLLIDAYCLRMQNDPIRRYEVLTGLLDRMISLADVDAEQTFKTHAGIPTPLVRFGDPQVLAMPIRVALSFVGCLFVCKLLSNIPFRFLGEIEKINTKIAEGLQMMSENIIASVEEDVTIAEVLRITSSYVVGTAFNSFGKALNLAFRMTGNVPNSGDDNSDYAKRHKVAIFNTSALDEARVFACWAPTEWETSISMVLRDAAMASVGLLECHTFVKRYRDQVLDALAPAMEVLESRIPKGTKKRHVKRTPVNKRPRRVESSSSDSSAWDSGSESQAEAS